jgi:uncharacterized protein (TIGR02246 family)
VGLQLSSVQQQCEAALAQVQSAWNAAALTWDADAFADVYTDDGLLYGGRPKHSIGRGEIRSYFESYTGAIKSASLNLTGQHTRVLGDGVFLTQGAGEFQFILAGGNPSRIVLRTTLLLVQREVCWKILQHHFSESPALPPLGPG